MEGIALLLERNGLPRIAGRIVAYLLVCQPECQTARDLRHALGASRASVSTMTRLLVRIGMIEEVPLPGQRTTAFRFPPDRVDRLFMDAVEQIHQLREVLEGGLPLVEQQPAPARSRLVELVRLYRFLDAEVPVLLSRFRTEAGRTGASQ